MRRPTQATRRGLLLGIALGLGTLRDERGGSRVRPRSTDLRAAVGEAASSVELLRLFTFALAELRATAAAADLSDDAAHALGDVVGERLWSLATAGGGFGDATHFAPLGDLARTVRESRSSDWSRRAPRTAVNDFHRVLARSLDESARGLTRIVAPLARLPGESRVLITAFDPFTDAGWNPAAAAALALDGVCVPIDRDRFARIASVIFPVDYRRFAQEIVESAVRPALPDLDAIVTMSMEPTFRELMAVERYAVNFHWVDPAVNATDAGPAVVSGPIPPCVRALGEAPPPERAVAPAWSRVDELAAPRRADRWETVVRSTLRLRFASRAEAVAAMGDLAAPVEWTLRDASVLVRDPLVIGRLLAACAARPAQAGDQLAWRALSGANRLFAATVTAGPGGNFLSNEVSYRVLRLIGAAAGPGRAVRSFHLHTPTAPALADPAAAAVRDRVIAEGRRLVAACLR